MSRLKVFVEVGYYEITIRPMREGDKPLYYAGAGGLFENHRNAFVSFETAMRHIDRKKFDDHFSVHKSFKDEYLDFCGNNICTPISEEDIRWSDCGEWMLN